MTAAISRLSSLTYITGESRPSDKGWTRSSRSWDKGKGEKGGEGGGGGLKKFFFVPLEPQFGLKRTGTPGLPGPSTGSASVYDQSSHVY